MKIDREIAVRAQQDASDALRRHVRTVAAVLGFMVVAVLGACSLKTVEPGHRGVKVTFGKPHAESLPEGLYFINPFTSRLVEMDVRQQKWEAKTAAYTKDVQQAQISFVLTYGLSATEAHAVYREVGTDWAEKLVAQVVEEEIKREIGQHEAVDLVSQRNDAARAMEANITGILARRRVAVTGFQLTNIDYTTEFEQSVEAKVIAQQRAIEEQNRTVQIREQATQKIEAARGDSEATVLRAKAEAESIRIRANALAANAKLVEWEAIQKWNGQLPTYTMGGAIPFINLPAR